MTPPSSPLPTTTDAPPPDEVPVLEAIPVPLSATVRGGLVGVALVLLLVFGIALWLNPYEADGSRRAHGTHMQMGLGECGFLKFTGVPCPSCGMTTSFALLVRGDLIGSFQANAAGTFLALFCLALIVWCLASAWHRQTVFVRSVEWPIVVLVIGFTGLTVVRWMLVVVWIFATRGTAAG